MTTATVKHISECFIRPKYEVAESKHRYHLGAWDLIMLSGEYIQKGLLFVKPSEVNDQDYSTEELIHNLKDSLSRTLVHYYPLAGRFATEVDEDLHQCIVFVDCNKGPGAKFIHAALDMTVSDILSPTDVPLVVQKLFDHHKAVNHDGHTMPLLSVQVTELLDGVFIGCSMNHVLGDGTSYWQFWDTWSNFHKAIGKDYELPNVPIHSRWSPEGYGLPIPLPYTHPDEFIVRLEAQDLRERIFHFSTESIAMLKAKANEEANVENKMISSFQALTAFVWRSVIRANAVTHDQDTSCSLAINNRPRMKPPLPQEYFGSFAFMVKATTTAGALLTQTLGSVALQLHEAVASYTDKNILDSAEGWLQRPYIVNHGTFFGLNNVHMGSSPRFNMYGSEFGLGKAVAIRSGYANKFSGKVSAFPGYQGGGSIGLEICLRPESMRALESDDEFMAAVLTD